MNKKARATFMMEHKRFKDSKSGERSLQPLNDSFILQKL